MGALMPPIPSMPMNSPWPIHNGQGGPSVEIASPSPIISELKITVARVPIRPASWDMMMPPTPEPSQASELASAGTERAPPASPAISFRATAVIQAAPNDIAKTKRAADATAHEVLVSTEAGGDCNIGCFLQTAHDSTTHILAGLLVMLRCIAADYRPSIPPTIWPIAPIGPPGPRERRACPPP